MPNDTPEYREQLLELAEELLNEHGREEVQELLDADDLRSARIYLLGALDKGVMEHDLPEVEAQAKYKILGFDPEESSAVRQRAQK